MWAVTEPRPFDPFPSQTELVIGLVGPVGIDLSEFFSSLATVLTRFKYECHHIHLSDQLRAMDWDEELVEEPADERLWSYMSAGNRLREMWDRDDAFALLAINAITFARSRVSGDRERPLERHAYVLRSLKRKEEAALLLDVYGSRFILLSIYAPEAARLERLERRIAQSRVHPIAPTPVYTAQQLIRRDEAEATEHGQNVRRIFHEGDFFVDATGDIEPQLARTMEILFGHPNRTPTRDEAGMFTLRLPPSGPRNWEGRSARRSAPVTARWSRSARMRCPARAAASIGRATSPTGENSRSGETPTTSARRALRSE